MADLAIDSPIYGDARSIAMGATATLFYGTLEGEVIGAVLRLYEAGCDARDDSAGPDVADKWMHALDLFLRSAAILAAAHHKEITNAD